MSPGLVLTPGSRVPAVRVRDEFDGMHMRARLHGGVRVWE